MTITWCMVPKQTEFFLILDRFLPFYPLNNPKNQILKKRKKRLEISFYTSLPKIIIISYTVPEIRRVTNVIFIFHVGLFFCPFTPLTTQKIKIFKKWKKAPGDIIILHMYTKNYDYMMYGSWGMVRDERTNRRKKWHIEVAAPPNENRFSLRLNIFIFLYNGISNQNLWINFQKSPLIHRKTISQNRLSGFHQIWSECVKIN